MLNPSRNEMQIEIGGKTRTMCATLEAIVKLEEALGRGLLDVLMQAKNPMANGTSLKMLDVAQIILWGLYGAGETEDVHKGILGVSRTPITIDGVLAWVWKERDEGRYVSLNARAYAFLSMSLNVDNSGVGGGEGPAEGK